MSARAGSLTRRGSTTGWYVRQPGELAVVSEGESLHDRGVESEGECRRELEVLDHERRRASMGEGEGGGSRTRTSASYSERCCEQMDMEITSTTAPLYFALSWVGVVDMMDV